MHLVVQLLELSPFTDNNIRGGELWSCNQTRGLIGVSTAVQIDKLTKYLWWSCKSHRYLEAFS